MTIYRVTATSRNRWACATAKYHNLVCLFSRNLCMFSFPHINAEKVPNAQKLVSDLHSKGSLQ